MGFFSQNVTAHFNPRSPHGERHQQEDTMPEKQKISIHAPRTGSDEIQFDGEGSFV